MALELHCHPSPNFRRVIQRFEMSEVPIRNTIMTTANAGAAAMVKEARGNLRTMVYTAPIPKSAERNGNDLAYFLKDGGRRTGRVWKACKVVPASGTRDEAIATAYVSDADFPSYFYAYILNFGGTTIDYDARPFWTRAERTMKAKYRALGEVAVGTIKKILEGREGYAEVSLISDAELGTHVSAEGI